MTKVDLLTHFDDIVTPRHDPTPERGGEILTRNAFHAQLKTTKSVFDKLRERTGLTGDGAPLVDAALALGRTGVPTLAINPLGTQTERDEQTGLANLIKGLSGMFRNPVAHDPRRTVSDDELLDPDELVHVIPP